MSEANNVLSLADFRKKKNLDFTARAMVTRERYACTSCETDRFICLTNGRVLCATCGTQISNMTTNVTEPVPK